MKKDDFLWFQNWCKIHDEDQFKPPVNIQIETLDNPGWLFIVDLDGTELENQQSQKIEITRSDNDWVQCALRENKFKGACGPTNLFDCFKIFRKWSESFLNAHENQILETHSIKKVHSIEKNELIWLQYWFYIHCNGDWEHSNGIKIEKLANSSWFLTIKLEDTELETQVFEDIKMEQSKSDWLNCCINNYQFESICSLTNFYAAIEIFRHWAECFLLGPDQRKLELLQKKGIHFIEKNDFAWLQQWYYIYCNKEWNLSERIHLKTTDNPGWLLTINIKDTALEYEEFRKIKIDNSDDDWIQCEVKNGTFEGKCSPTKICDTLKIFRNWTEPK